MGFFVAAYMLLHAGGLLGPLECRVITGCAAVQASSWAKILGVPVPAWGVAGYSLLFVLGLVGLQPRFVDDRRVATALLGFAGFAFAFSAFLTGLEAVVIQAWCQWCVVSFVLSTLVAILALSEVPRLRRSRVDEE